MAKEEDAVMLQTMNEKIRAIAGTFVLASVALGWYVSPWWYLFTAFVGLNLLQSAFTRWCLMEDILRWTGVHRDEPRIPAPPGTPSPLA
jgi:hypothetical protein